MQTIAILAQKGGSGKTTVAINLAVAAEQACCPARILDTDPQGSAMAWADERGGDAPRVHTALARRLPKDLDDADLDGIELCIIDTAPHAQGEALAAARLAELVLIPCRPSLFDLHAITATVELAQIAGTAVAVVLNAVPARGPLAAEATEALEDRGVRVLPHQLGQRQAFVHALTRGAGVQEYEPRGRAAGEVDALYNGIVRRERPDLPRPQPNLRLVGTG